MSTEQSGEDLFRRFAAGGFEQLIHGEPEQLSQYLEKQASATGSAAFVFVAQAIREVYTLFLEHNEAGGIQVDFVRELDSLVHDSLAQIENADPSRAATAAKNLRDEVLVRVRRYDPRAHY
jgi:hypothetical protein